MLEEDLKKEIKMKCEKEGKFDLREERIKSLANQASQSMGADIDLNTVQEFANQILSLNAYREELEDYLDGLMEKSAPNLKAIVGSLIGAEKALYRFLKTGEKKPKHGLIFQWSQIRGSRPWIRGKISRLIAGKLGLASKVDYFSGEFMGDTLSKEIDEKIRGLGEKYPNPPPKKEVTQPTKPRRRKTKRK